MIWYASNGKERIKQMQKIQKFSLFFLSMFLWNTPAQAFSVKHDFFVTVGVFDASRTEFSYTLTPSNYQITSTVKTNGLFNTLYPFIAEYRTSGNIIGGKMVATDYNYTSKSRFNTRGKKVFFDKNGEPSYRISSKNGKEKKHPFDKSPTPADTFDLQTVLAKLTKQYNELGFCHARFAVYDGKRRFDVVANDQGADILSENEHSSYSGKASKCSIHIDKLLSEEDDTLWEFSANKPIYFWIVKDDKTKHAFIARIQIKETPLGELNAYAEKITIKD